MNRTMEPSIATQPVGHDDLDALGRLFRDHTGRPADLDVIAGWVSASPSACVRRDGDLAGFVVTRRFAPDLLELANLLVAPAARGHGLGSLLVATVEREAESRGLAGIVVVTSMGNETVAPKRAAAPFYRSLGYRDAVQTDATVVLAKVFGDAR